VLDPFRDTEVTRTTLLVFLTVPLGVLVLAVIILAAGRGDPDTTGRRAFAVYLGAVNFVAVFTLVFASFATVQSLATLVVDGVDEDAAVRGAVQAALIVAAAVIVLVFHTRRRRELRAESEFVSRHHERQEGVAQLIAQAWLRLAALYVFVRAWREVAADRA